MNKLLVILGPTATGKSDLAVKIAKKYNGEVISADSRQVYTGLDIGTGKITKKEMQGVPHHMLDVVSPKKSYSVVAWKTEVEKIIKDTHSRGKLPIICGGTGFYIESIVDGIVHPDVEMNKDLREKLKKLSTEKLVQMLQKLDKKRLENIDTKNPVRLIRAIEIAKALGKVPEVKKTKSPFQILEIGTHIDDIDLREKIGKRLKDRIKAGMMDEAKKLHENGLSWKRMRELGLEYGYLADLLQSKMTKEDFETKLEVEIWRYSRRQITWFKRDKRIYWFNPKDTKSIEKIVDEFLANTHF